MAKIDTFRAQLSGGGARANQFRVMLTFPGSLGGGLQTIALVKAEFMVRAAQLPGSSIPEIDVFYRGRPTKVAGDRTFQPWQVTCYNDTDFAIRNSMETWMANIANNGGTNGILNSSEYQTKMTVMQLDRNDNIIKTYEFFNAFPTEITPIQLTFDQQGAIEEFDITFAYDYWQSASTLEAEA